MRPPCLPAGAVESWPVALSVAGSDPSAGAGIQADLKTFAALGVYGATVVTAVTSQNTRGLTDSHAVPIRHLTSQLEAVLEDLPVAAVKTGLIPTPAAVEKLAGRLAGAGWQGRLVVDPVLSTSMGQLLMDAETVVALKQYLLPLAGLVTPNLQEAQSLTGREGAPEDLAREILDMGAGAVLITGLEAPEETLRDLLVTGDAVLEVSHVRLDSSSTHGTGCTLSAAVTAYLARGDLLPQALRRAADYVHAAIARARPLGSGHGPLNHFHRFWPV